MGYPKSSEHEVPSFDEVMSEKKQTQVPSFDEVMGADVKKKEPTDSNNGVKPSSPTPSNSTSQSVFGKFPTKDEYNTTHPAQAVDEGGFQPTNLSSRKKRVMAVSDYLPAIKDMNQKAIADETFRQKPITDIDVKDKLQRAEQHKENVKQAIKNTTEKRLKIMGIDAPEGSPLYNEQKAKIEKAVLNGDATYHSKDGVPGLDRTVKWNEDLVNGWNEAIDANDEAATFANDMTTEQQVEFLNKKQTEQPPSEFYENRSGVGHLVGGAGPFLAKATAGAVVGGALAAAAPETGGLSLAGLPTAMSFIFTAPDAKNQGILREVSSRYQIIKNEHPEMSDIDAMEEAKKGGVLAGGVGGIVENALFMGAMDVPIPLQGKSVIGKFVKGTLKSGANMGAATAVANAGQLAERAAEGYKVTPEQVIDSSIETFKENFTAGSLLHAVMQGVAGVGNIPKAVKSAFKFGLKDTPMESIVSTLDANVKAGNVSPEVATKTVEDIEGYRAALAKTAQGLTPETQASVAGLIQAKDNLIAEMATKDETQHAPYQEKIAALNEQIKKITETNDPLKYEVDDVTGKPLGEPATETTEVKGNPEEISQPIELSVEPKKEEVVPNEPLSDVSGEGSVGVGGDVGSTTNVLNETQKSNPTVWQKIKDAFNNLVSKTKEYLNKAKGTQYEELAKVLGDHLKNVRTSTIEDLKGVLGEKIGGQLQKLHILVNSGKGDLQTFFHEAMHHITFEKISQYLNNNHENLKPHEIDAIQNLQRIFTDSKAKIEAMKVKTSFHYGFTNLHEFISEAFSNPEFQRLLKELPSEGKHPTVFKAFLDAIAKLMGLKDATILNDIFHHTEKLLDKPKSENEGIAELYHQAKAEGTHPDFVKAVEQSLKETPKSETKPIQNEPAKEEPVSAVSSEVGGVGAGGDVKVQGSEYKGVTGTTSVNVKEKDGIIKATFKGTRSDKPNATIGASGYRYGGKAVKETLSDFEKDYGVKVDEIIDGVDIAEITVLEERAEVNPRQGVGTGQSVTLRIRDTDGNIINDVNIVVNKRKFTEQPKSENKPIQKEPVKEEPVSAVSSEVEDSSMPTSLRGVKYSDIVVGDKHLEDILSDNKLSEDEKKQVREIFARGVDYFKFDKEGEQKFQEKFSNPEDITDVADIITGVSAAQQSAFNFHNTKNYDNVKDAVNYIANNPNDYSPKVVKAVKEIKQKLDNPSSSMNRLYAIDVMKELGIKENPVPQEVKSETKPIQNEQTKANEVSITQEGESPTTTTVDKVSEGTTEGKESGKKPPPIEPAEPVGEEDGSDGKVVGMTREIMRQEKIDSNLTDAENLFVGGTDKKAWADVNKKIEANPNLYKERVNATFEDALNGERPKVSDEDALIGLHEKVTLRIEHNEISQKIADAKLKGDNLSVIPLELQREAIENRQIENKQFIKLVGSSGGKLLRSISFLSGEDFSFAGLTHSIENEQGTPLTKEQQGKFRKLAEDHAALVKELNDLHTRIKADDEIRTRNEESNRKKFEEETIAKLKIEVEKEKNKPSKPTRSKDVVKAELDKAREQFRRDSQQMSSGGLQSIESFVKMVKLAVEYGVKSAADFIKEFKDDLKGFSEKEIEDAYNKVGNPNSFENLTNKAIELADGELHEGMKPTIDKMLKAIVVENPEITHIEATDKIYNALADAIPDVTRDEVRDLISGYGKYKELNKEQVPTAIREIKTQNRLDAALDAVKVKNELPLRSGMERHAKTEATRKKEAEVLRVIKEKGLTPELSAEDIDRQYKSAEDTYQKRLENAIADIEKEIETGERKKKANSKEYNSERSEQLKKDLERLKKIRDEKFAEPVKTDGEKKIDALRKRRDDILYKNEGKPKKESIITPDEQAEIEKLNDEIAEAKKLSGQIKSKPFQTDAEKRVESDKKKLENLKSKLDDLIAGKVKDKKVNEPDSDEAKDLKKQIKAIEHPPKTEAEKKAAKESAKVKATEKAIADINNEIDLLKNGKVPEGEPTVKSKDGKQIFDFKKKQADKVTNDRIKELEALKENLQDEKSNLIPAEIKKQAIISKERTNRQRKLTNLETQVKEGKYGTKPKVEPLPYDKQVADINFKIKKLESVVANEKEKIRLANRGKVEKAIDGLSKYQRFMIFLNPWGMGRLAYAAIFRPVMKIPNEAAKYALSKIPGAKRIMEKSPGMYRPTLGSAARATGNYYSALISKSTFKDALSEYKRRSNYSIRNDAEATDRYQGKLDFALSAPEMTHGFMKAFPKIAAHEATYKAALENLSNTTDPRTGKPYDITDPTVRQIAIEEAMREGYADVFMSHSELSNMSNKMLAGMATSENMAIQAAGLYGKQLQPVLRVPANFYHEVLQQLPVIGLLDAAQIVARSGETGARKLKDGSYRGVNNLTPDQAHRAARAMVNSAVGIMMVGVGIALYKKYEDEIVKKIEEYKYWAHNTGLPLIMMGLGIAADMKHGKSKTGAIMDNVIHTTIEETTKLPQLKAAAQVTKLSWAAAKAAAGKGNWDGASKQAKEMLATLLIPAGAAELAKRMDDNQKRDPETFKEILEMRIPGLRDNVPGGVDLKNPTLKLFHDKGASMPDYTPSKIPIKYINGKPAEYLDSQKPQVQEDYIKNHKTNYEAELNKLKDGVYKVYKKSDGGVHIQGKKTNEKGMTYTSFKDLTDEQVQYLEGQLTRRATVKTKKALKFELDDTEKTDDQ